ncbi:MAG: RDD family protein, partial [Bradymonadaceae bacterium]
MVNELVDNRLSVETPEGVEFAIDSAGPLARLLAATIDFSIRAIVYSTLGIAFAFLGKTGMGLFMICLFFIEWGYPIYFEMYHNGSTPGKRLLKLQVLHTDGTPISWHGSILRNLLRVADFLPFGYVAGMVSMSATSRFQRLGDLAADTIVCYRTEVHTTYRPSHDDVEAVVVTEPLNLDEQRAIVSFAERSQRLGPERAQELASILEPLTELGAGSSFVLARCRRGRRLVALATSCQQKHRREQSSTSH